MGAFIRAMQQVRFGITLLMGKTALSIELKAKGKEPELDEEAWEEFFGDVSGLLTDYLEKNLRRDAEAGFLESIDAGVVVEPDSGDFDNGRLTFLFSDSWAIGAEAAEHWYALAMAACRSKVEKAVGKRGFKWVNPPSELAELVRAGTSTLPLLVIGEEIVGVREGGELEVTEGVNLTLSEKDKARVQEVAKTRQCQCELCQQARLKR